MTVTLDEANALAKRKWGVSGVAAHVSSCTHLHCTAHTRSAVGFASPYGGAEVFLGVGRSFEEAFGDADRNPRTAEWLRRLAKVPR